MRLKVPCSVVSSTALARLNRRGNLAIDDFGVTVHTLDETIEVVVFGAHRRQLIAGLRAIADRLEADDVSAVAEVVA